MKKFFVLFFLLACTGNILAQASFKVSVADKKRIVTGSQEFSKSDNEIFANALLWAIDRGSQLKETIVNCDYENMRFTMAYSIVQEGGNTFTADLTIQVGQHRMVYLVSNIKGLPNGLSAFLGATSFNKMNPEKKPKQQEMITEFETLNKKELQALLKYVDTKSTVTSRWEAITQGQLEKGMTEDEVILILGKPVDVQKSGSTKQMMYNQFTYVFFENDVVKSFMQ